MSQLLPSSTRTNLRGWALDLSIGALALTVVAALLLGSPLLSPATASRGPRAGSSAPSALLPAAAIPGDGTYQLLVGDTTQPIAANGDFPLGGSLFGQISASHATDGPLRRNLDVFLYQNSAAAQPVVGANVRVFAHMRGMSEMGTLNQTAAPASAGHYLVSLAFPMSGEWQIDLSVDSATEHSTVPLLFYVWS